MSDAVGAVGAGSFVTVCLHTQVKSESAGKARRLRGIDKEAHPNPLLQTERVQQRREFNVKLIGIDRRQSKGRRGEANDDL
jgi:hypothetical protein